MASAVVGAIGALKGPWHGGAPAEVVDQLHEMGSIDQAEAWIRATLDRGERLMGFGHRVYRAYDPRAAALRAVAESQAGMADWLDKAVAVEEIALRVLAEFKPDYPIKTNVEYYAAAVLQGVGLPPNLFPATFALARHAGWTAHCLEQAQANVLIRPDVRYVGPPERSPPGLSDPHPRAGVARRGCRSARAPACLPRAPPRPGPGDAAARRAPRGRGGSRRDAASGSIAASAAAGPSRSATRQRAIERHDRGRLDPIQGVVQRYDRRPAGGGPGAATWRAPPGWPPGAGSVPGRAMRSARASSSTAPPMAARSQRERSWSRQQHERAVGREARV